MSHQQILLVWGGLLVWILEKTPAKMQNPHQQSKENTSRFIILELMKFQKSGSPFYMVPLFFVVVHRGSMVRGKEWVCRGGHSNSRTRVCGGCAWDECAADITTRRSCGRKQEASKQRTSQ